LTLRKEYITDIKLGLVTDTLDMSGKVIAAKRVGEIGSGRVLSILDKFKGTISQVPPVYSSVKYKGKPSYIYARKGNLLNLKPKTVHIYDIGLVSFSGDLVTIKVNCSSGTYIRSLAYDIGNMLGVGASVSKLKRTRIGNYGLEDSIGIENFLKRNFREGDLESNTFIVSLEKLLDQNGEVQVRDEFNSRIKNGAPIKGNMIKRPETIANDLFRSECLLKVKDGNKNLLAVHRILSKDFFADSVDYNLKLTESIVIL
jgi:tRNA pseudouridine55 synthase